MVQQTEKNIKIKNAILIINVCCPIELISVFKCSLVKKYGGRYNKPSLTN